MRDLTEELSNVKCATIKKFSDDSSCKSSDICHHCACPELGVDKAALRRFPCNCTACDDAITQPWVNGITDPALWPQFKDATHCFFKPMLEGVHQNQWHFAKLVPRAGTDEDEVDEEKQLVLRHVTTSVAGSIEVGKIGALAFEQHKGENNKEGHCLIGFTGSPRTEQGEGTTGCAWKVDCHWLRSVLTAIIGTQSPCRNRLLIWRTWLPLMWK